MNLKELIRFSIEEKYAYLDVTNGRIKTFFSEAEFIPINNLWETLSDYLFGQDYILLLDTEERKIYNTFRRTIYHVNNPPSHPILSYLYQEYKNNKGDIEIVCKDGKKINVHSIVLLSYNNTFLNNLVESKFNNDVKKLNYSYKIVKNFIKLLYIGNIKDLQEKQYLKLLNLLDYLLMSDLLLLIFKKFFNLYPMSASKYYRDHPFHFKNECGLNILITDIEEQKRFVISQREFRMRSNIIKEINMETLVIDDKTILARGKYEDKYIVYLEYSKVEYTNPYGFCGFMVYDSNGRKRPDLISYIKTCFRCYDLDEENEKELCSKYSITPYFSS